MKGLLKNIQNKEKSSQKVCATIRLVRWIEVRSRYSFYSKLILLGARVRHLNSDFSDFHCNSNSQILT